MQVEKLMQLSELRYAEKKAKIEMQDGSTMICEPDWWSEEEDGVSYSVKLVEPWKKYQIGSFLTVSEKMILNVKEI